MARPKEFDVDDVLQRALELFWQRGFAATSLHDLVAAMGIQKASLYATFGDKHALYLTALRRYQERALAKLAERMAKATSPLEELTALLDDVVNAAASRDGRRGCFCVNADIEMSPHDEAVAEQSRSHHERMLGVLTATIERARSLGEVPSRAEPEALATFVVGVITALNVLGRRRANRAQLTALRDQAVFALTH